MNLHIHSEAADSKYREVKLSEETISNALKSAEDLVEVKLREEEQNRERT